jgi:hypothetical protein
MLLLSFFFLLAHYLRNDRSAQEAQASALKARRRMQLFVSFHYCWLSFTLMLVLQDCKNVVDAVQVHDCRCHNECNRVHALHPAVVKQGETNQQKKLREKLERQQQQPAKQQKQQQQQQPAKQKAQQRRPQSETPTDRRSSLRSATPAMPKQQSVPPKKQYVSLEKRMENWAAFRKSMAEAVQLWKKEKLEKAKAEKAKAKKQQEQAAKTGKKGAPKRRKSNSTTTTTTAAAPSDIAAKRNARKVRRARCRHDAAAGGCVFGILKLPDDERKMFSWIGPNNITVLKLNSKEETPAQLKKKKLLLEELQRIGAVKHCGMHWVSRKVAISAKPELHAKLTELINRYRAMYNALVSALNNDLSVTFKKLGDMTCENGLEKLLATLKGISTTEVHGLSAEVKLLLDLKFKLEQRK